MSKIVIAILTYHHHKPINTFLLISKYLINIFILMERLTFLGSEEGKFVSSANNISRILQCYVIHFGIKIEEEGGM
jgi:hypothetical protein